MINKVNKNVLRKKRSLRVRNKVVGTAERPRLNVYRSLTNIYAQIIDDTVGHTLVSVSSQNKEIADLIKGKNKKDTAFIVGEKIAEAALKAKIKTVVFDRAGYLYTGRVKALADGARGKGLVF